jgi:hypothetical protein
MVSQPGLKNALIFAIDVFYRRWISEVKVGRGIRKKEKGAFTSNFNKSICFQ